jgi:imidazolonepropionase-like amidohydrolase
LYRFHAVCIAATLVAATSCSCRNATRDALVITKIAVIDCEAGRSLADMTVVIRGDRIVSVDQKGPVPPNAAVIDGHGMFLIPGLWDMHVHLSYARSSALLALVAYGVTGVRDMGGDLAELDRWRSQVLDGVVLGPSIVRAGPLLNGNESESYELAVRTPEEARTAVRTLQKAGVDFVKIYRGLPRNAFFAAASEARRLRLPFSGHVAEGVSPAEASDAGQASIEHLETFFEGSFEKEHAGEDQARAIATWRARSADTLALRLKANGTMVTPTLVSNSQLLRLLKSHTPDPELRYVAQSARHKAEKTLAELRPKANAMLAEFGPILEQTRPIAPLLWRRGVKLLAGTDLSYIHVPGASLHDELEMMANSGISPAAVLCAATANPAAFLRLPDSGKIAPGMHADLVLLAANPLADIRNTRHIQGVILRGRYLDRNALDHLLRETERLASLN